MAETENTWCKRETKQFICKSGNIITVRRPGPDLSLKSAKIQRILLKYPDAQDPAKTLEVIEKLPDNELEDVMAFARILVADVVINPPLSLHPKEGQLSPDDIPPIDFWDIFDQASKGFPTMPVKTTEGETTIEAVQNFPEQSGSSPDAGKDSGDVEGFPC